MSKHHTDPLLEALKEGRSYTWTVPDGGNRASMRKAIQHGQTLTMSPVDDPGQVRVGDIVLVNWHQGTLFHMVGEVQGDQFLIVNSLGKVNGWVAGKDILGRVTEMVDGEPRPDIPVMLEQLGEAYRVILASDQGSKEDADRVGTIMDDLRWYADRIGKDRWDEMPRDNKWNFAQNLWNLTKQVKKGIAPTPERLLYFIDRGKEIVGLASEIHRLFEHSGEE